MTNEEFQKTVKIGDILIVQEDNTRYSEGINFKFVRFAYCRHKNVNLSCKDCMGQVVYEKYGFDNVTSEGCQREFNDPITKDYLVIKVDIIPGPEWIDDGEWEI